MANRDREEDGSLETLLFGEKPTVKDLADPKKRKQVMRAAKMMGFEVRREQMIRMGIGVAVVLVVLLIGLWAIAKALGLLFWAILAMAACALVVKLIGNAKVDSARLPVVPAGRLEAETKKAESERKRIDAEEREADRRAEAALAELERKLNDK